MNLAAAKEQLQRSLERLGITHLNNLAVHGINLKQHLAWALAGPGAEFMAWALGEKLVGQVGFSSHGSPELISAAISSGCFAFANLHLHLFDPLRLPLAQMALARGMGVLAISPADKGGQLYAPPALLLMVCAKWSTLTHTQEMKRLLRFSNFTTLNVFNYLSISKYLRVCNSPSIVSLMLSKSV